MRFANQSRLFTLIHPRLSAPVHSLRKRDNSMSLAHQTRGISAITHTERFGFESSRLSSIDPCHEAFWDFFGESWFAREEYEARANFFLFEISHWDHFHPHRTLPVPPWTSSLEILEFWKVFKWSFGIFDRLLMILSTPKDYRSSQSITIDSWRPNFILHYFEFNFLTGDYHKLGLERLLHHDVKGELFFWGVDRRWQFCSNGTA